MHIDQLERLLRGALPELKLTRDEPMSRRTSFRIGGPADLVADPANPQELETVLRTLHRAGERPFLLGNGTNLLISDKGIRGVVVATSGVRGLRLEGQNRLCAACGETLAHTAVFARDHGLTGLEFAHGIPGTVGGALCMNAGAYGGEMKQVVRETRALRADGEIITLRGEEHCFGYRDSAFHRDGTLVALETVLELREGEPHRIGEVMRELMERRKASQPLELPSAGSTFKRPEGYFAGTLIDQAGLKGKRIGDAQVSEKHAGFIVNRGNATCAQVLTLIAAVQNTVMQKFGVRLEPEVRPMGEF